MIILNKIKIGVEKGYYTKQGNKEKWRGIKLKSFLSFYL